MSELLSVAIQNPLLYSAAAVGAAVVAKTSLGVAQAIYRHYLKSGYDLPQRYGKGSYVLITGPSRNSIGFAYAEKFARLGFNLILVGRSEARLNEVVSDVKRIAPLVNILTVVLDLAKSSEPGLFEKLYAQVKHLDISIIINNAGVVGYGLPFSEASTQENLDVITINAIPSVLLTQQFVPALQARKSKSALIFTSSVVGSWPAAGVAVYGATKAFLDHFGNAIHHELGGNVDVLVADPGMVATNMNPKKPNGWDILTPEQHVDGVLKHLGSTVQTEATPGHAWFKFKIADLMPTSLSAKALIPFVEQEREERRLQKSRQAA